MRGALAILAVASCGRLGFDRREQVASGEPDAANTRDASSILDAAGGSGSALAPDAAPMCPTTYTLAYNGSKYRVGAGELWVKAELACEADGYGMHLVTIGNFAEQQKIEGYLGGSQPGWIGVSDRKTNNAFLAVTGGVETYLPWAASYPSFAGPGCVILDPAVRNYRDGDCTQTLPYVCECDLVAADPTSY